MAQNASSGPGLSRRRFMHGTLGAAALSIIPEAPRRTAADAPDSPLPAGPALQNIGGHAWRVKEATHGDQPIPAVVPGDIFTDLMAAGQIANPYFRDNNAKAQWVGTKTWRYFGRFVPASTILDKQFILLRCHGLDTLATIWINGAQVGTADNMYRTWEFDIKNRIKPGENTIEIEFAPLAPYAAERIDKYKRNHGLLLKATQSWVRKAPYMWGWDWCRPLLTCGIWKPIELVGFNRRIIDVGVDQDLSNPDVAKLHVAVGTQGGPKENLRTRVTVFFNGRSIATKTMRVTKSRSASDLKIQNPHLWWPNGMGPQNLYVVEVELLDAGRNVLDKARRRIGLRTVRQVKKREAVSVHLEVNGVAFFAKGADWIPADNIPTRVTPQILRRYMEDARDCHFNILRFWGGGYYESQAQFDACDELGLLVIFEFKFANHFYPVFDEPWLENVRREVREQVRINRHHPCIALWSGNNEIYWFHGFNTLFRKTIGGIVHKELPGANYQLGSGDPGSSIDIHYWGPWNVVDPPKSFQSRNGFITEFGMQSFPQPRTVDAYTLPADRHNLYSKVMVYHERSFGRYGIDGMMHAVNHYFGATPRDFDAALWLTQIAQAYVIGYGVEHWRRSMPRSMATLIWQLNDSWPGPTWSMIDWYHRWKAIMYAARRFFAPVLVSARTDAKSGDIEAWVSSDRMQSLHAELMLHVTDLHGKTLHTSSRSMTVPPRTSHMGLRWNYPAPAEHPARENVLVWTGLRAGGQTLSEGCHFFVAPRNLRLPEPGLSHRVTPGADGSFKVVVHSQKPALWMWVNLKGVDAKYSDNFVHMPAGGHVAIDVRPTTPISLVEFQRQLEVRNLRDVSAVGA